MMKKKLFSGALIFAMAAAVAVTPVLATETGTEIESAATEAEVSETEVSATEVSETEVSDNEVSETEVEAAGLADESAPEPIVDTEAEAGESSSDGAYDDHTISVYTVSGSEEDTDEPGSNVDSDDRDQTEDEKNEVSPTVKKLIVDGMTGWWYVDENGEVDRSYTGFATNENGSWYAEAGLVTKTTNGVFKDVTGTIGSKNEWYYVLNSKVQYDFTGLADYKNDSGWWYITDGRVDRSVTTVAKNKNGWWYVRNGKVDKSYTGFATNGNGSWYMEKGKLLRDQNTVIKDTNGALGSKNDWYYVIGSKVQYNFTGLADYKNDSGWWYITNGKVDRSVNTVAKNKNGWWYVRNGKVDKSYTGFATNGNGSWYMEKGKLLRDQNTVIKDTNGALGSKNDWYYVIGSKVQYNFTGLADYKNDSGWWYITDGKVDRSVNTVAKNKNGWYYVANGKVDKSYTGIAENENGWWYIKNGKRDSSAGDYSFAAGTSQIIDVQTSGSTGTLTLYNKDGHHFTKSFSVSCYVGRNGISSSKKEGDGKTPAGVYTLGQAFGVASDPGCTRSYLKVNSNYYWVDDSSSKYYNQLVDVSQTGVAWSSAEHLIDSSSAYKYAIAIDYNTSCTPDKGSAIFLHCSVGTPTSGCVTVSESYMVKILKSLNSDTRIYIH